MFHSRDRTHKSKVTQKAEVRSCPSEVFPKRTLPLWRIFGYFLFEKKVTAGAGCVSPQIDFAEVRRRSSAPSPACANKRKCLTKCAGAGLGTFLQKHCGHGLRKPAIVFAESSEKETSFPSHTRKGGRESETSRLALHRQRELCPASSWCKKEKKRPKPVRLRSL